MIIRQFFKRLMQATDPWLLAIFLVILSGAYLVMMSASPERFQAHTINVTVALSCMVLTSCIPTQRFSTFAVPLYLVGVALLVAVALFGVSSKGAQRWLSLGFTRIQPSELMKIAMPLMLAWYFQKREGALKVYDFIAAGILLAIPVGLIAKQPDLGTSILVFGAGAFVIYFAGLSWKLLIPVVLVFTVLFSTGIIYYEEHTEVCDAGVQWPGLKKYQRDRICTFLDPTTDPLGKGFHTIQSTIAVGSGGLLGKGWREGTQTHLDFIPERHTDFILAVLAEEFGLLGVITLVFMYILLILRGLIIALRARTLFSRLLGGAITMIFFTYAFVNMCMVAGVLPVVGVPLPFVSYGGTALVTLSIGVGILMSISHSNRTNRGRVVR